MRSNLIRATAVVTALLFPAWVAAEAAPAPGVAVETYSGPKGVDMASPRYPEDEIWKQGEGLVYLNFMVDTDGRAYEIAVADAVGDKAFQTEAIRALKRSVFEPARLDGQPIEAGALYAYSFQLNGGRDGAGRRFVSRYRALMKAIEDDDRAGADQRLASLKPENLYEHVYRELARYHYERRWGSLDGQSLALARAVGPNPQNSFLPDEMRVPTLQGLFAVQVEMHDFGGALETAARLADLSPDGQVHPEIDRVVSQIERYRHEEGSFSVDGSIPDGFTSWSLSLFKPAFSVDQVRGRVAEIKLRCAGSFVGFAYDPELVYRVSQQYMPCRVEVVGDPGTRFRLRQTDA